MSILRDGMARLGLPPSQGGRVTLRFCMSARIARYLAPLIEKLAADDLDGETYRCAIVEIATNRKDWGLYWGLTPLASICRNLV